MTKAMALTKEQIKLIEDNYKLGHFFAARWKLKTSLDYDDILSHCLLGLTKAAKHFDPERKVKFSSYVGFIIQNEILMALRTQRHTIMTVPISDLSNYGKNHMDSDYDMWDLIQSKFSSNNNVQDWIEQETIKEAIKNIPPKQKIVVELYMKEFNQPDIAKMTGFSQSYVSRLLNKAHKGIKNKLYKA